LFFLTKESNDKARGKSVKAKLSLLLRRSELLFFARAKKR